MSILVYVENTDGKFKKSAFEVVSYAKSIADNIQTDLVAISIGNVAEDELAGLGKYGASKVLNVNNEQLASFVNQAYASIIAEAVKNTGSKILVLSNSFSGKGLAPRIAAKLEAGLADGALELPTINGDKLTVKKTAFSNKAFATLELTSDI
ncbi:MAG TPA: electron transfer flavoprotein subunit alpha, partial [Sphingobacterium sp.]|nr:electron transfer flavoprotein subunit alpha [Sphingobacterium sp.]